MKIKVWISRRIGEGIIFSGAIFVLVGLWELSPGLSLMFSGAMTIVTGFLFYCIFGNSGKGDRHVK